EPRPETPVLVLAGQKSIERTFKSERVDGGNYKDRISCLIATRRGQKARVKMTVDLAIMYCDDGYDPGVLARFYGAPIVEEGVDTIHRYEVNPDKVSIYYNMHFNLKWEEVPWG